MGSITLFRRIHFAFWTGLVLMLGYSFGAYGLKIEEVSAPPPIQILNRDINKKVPLIHIKEINEGQIVGKVGTGARLVIGETVIVTHTDGSFEVPAEKFLVNIVDVKIPHGVKFVASRKGKKYYEVTSKSAERLAPKNRIYFKNEEDAEKMGYVR